MASTSAAGTTIRTESTITIDVGAYRGAIEPLGLGDVTITEVFDPTFEENQNVSMIRIQAQEGQEAVTAEIVRNVEAALKKSCQTSSSFRWTRSDQKSPAS